MQKIAVWPYDILPYKDMTITVPRGFKPLKLEQDGPSFLVFAEVDPDSAVDEIIEIKVISRYEKRDKKEMEDCSYIGSARHGEHWRHVYWRLAPDSNVDESNEH